MTLNPGLARLIIAVMTLILASSLTGCEEDDCWSPVTPYDRTHVEYDEITQDVEGLAALDVETVNGSVEIDSSTRNRLWVRVRKEVRAPGATEARRVAEAIRLRVERNGDEVRVFSDLPDVDRDVEIEVSYEIECPPGLELDLDTLNGEIRLTGRPVDVRAGAGNGRIIAALDELRGAGVFSLINGDVRARIADGNPSLAIDLVNGYVDVEIRPDYSGRVDLQTVNGGVTCELPLSEATRPRFSRLVGVLGDGGPSRIDVRAVNGNIRLTGS